MILLRSSPVMVINAFCISGGGADENSVRQSMSVYGMGIDSDAACNA